MDRQSYWNQDYLNYWKKRVEEANQNSEVSTVVPQDAVTGSDAVLSSFFKKHPFRPGNMNCFQLPMRIPKRAKQSGHSSQAKISGRIRSSEGPLKIGERVQIVN